MFRSRTFRHALSLAVLVGLGACATKAVRDDDFDSDKVAADAGPADAQGFNPDAPSIGSGSTEKADVKGTTYAPNGKLPLAGVLVYWSREEPEEIPDGVYCDTCVELPEGTSTISDEKGKFTLNLPVEQELFVVVQKGQFRRVTKVTVAKDEQEIEKKSTTLPGKMNKSKGDTIPTIAIMTQETASNRDIIHDALDKLGVTEYEFLNGESPSDHSVTENIDELSKYQIVMFPCGSEQPSEGDVETLREYAKRGGKIYTSDYALEYLNKTFEGVVSDISTGAQGLESCASGSCGPGRFTDDKLAAWMEATGDSSVELEGIYSKFGELHPISVPGIGDDAAMVDATPKVWSEVQGTDESWQQASFSITYGCGRGMFSIFHAHSNGSDLAPQEKALLFMLLEVSSCVKPGGDVH